MSEPQTNGLRTALGNRVGLLSRPFLGVCAAVLATLLLTAVTTVGKHVSTDLHPFIATTIRSFVGVLIIVPWYLRGGLGQLRTARPIFTLLRGFVFALAILIWFWSLPRVPIDLVMALGFTSMLFAILGAVLFLGEASKTYRWIGLFFGLVGGLIILRPGFVPLTAGVIAVLVSALLFAATRVMGKFLVRTDSPAALVVWQMGAVAVFSIPFAYYVWQWPTGVQWFWLVVLGLLTVLNNLAGAWAIRLADMGTIEPVGFLRLIWAALAGFVVFADVPDWFTIGGGVVVMASVLYIARNDRREGRAVVSAID